MHRHKRCTCQRPRSGLPAVELLEDRRLLSGLASLLHPQPFPISSVLGSVGSRVGALTQMFAGQVRSGTQAAIGPFGSVSQPVVGQAGAVSQQPVTGPGHLLAPSVSPQTGSVTWPVGANVSEGLLIPEPVAPPPGPVAPAVTFAAGGSPQVGATPLPAPLESFAPERFPGGSQQPTADVAASAVCPDDPAGVGTPAVQGRWDQAADLEERARAARTLVPKVSGLLTDFLPLDPAALERSVQEFVDPIEGAELTVTPEAVDLYPWLTAAAVAATAYEIARRRMQGFVASC